MTASAAIAGQIPLFAIGRAASVASVSRDEFGMLRRTVERTTDQLGKDIAGVGRDLDRFRREHAEQHAADASARVVTRRWLVGTFIAALVALEAPLFFLVAHVH